MKIPVPVCFVCNVKMVGAFSVASPDAPTQYGFFSGRVQLQKHGNACYNLRAFVCPSCNRVELFAFPLSSSPADNEYSDLYKK